MPRTRVRRAAPERLAARLTDRRSGRVVFVSHCLLNENVRYLGGACRPGAVDELVERWRAAGVGICQMPCPEQRAWGGVLKRRIVMVYGSRGTVRYRLRRPLGTLFLAATRRVYRRLAARVADEVADYERAGMRVEEVVAVAGSPSCGATVTLDVPRVLEGLARLDVDAVDRAAVNQVVSAAAVPGTGMFIAELSAALRHRGLVVTISEHDLLRELREDAASGG